MERFRVLNDDPGRIFAFGDIHGCSAELDVMIRYLEEDQGMGLADTPLFVGDYIDRGPDSRGVFERLLTLGIKYPKAIFLKGNHEDILAGYLGLGGCHQIGQLFNEGREFLASYGIPQGATSEEVLAGMPTTHVSFLLSLERYVFWDKFSFVHAGFNPLRDIYNQLDSDIYWIRDEFVMNIHRFDKVVVFGHTPYKDVFVNLPYKLGIDTGLVFGNKLTVLDVRGSKVFQLQLGSSKVSCKDI